MNNVAQRVGAVGDDVERGFEIVEGLLDLAGAFQVTAGDMEKQLQIVLDIRRLQRHRTLSVRPGFDRGRLCSTK